MVSLGPWRDGSRGKAGVGVRGWGDGLETTFCLFVCELAIFEICPHGLDPCSLSDDCALPQERTTLSVQSAPVNVEVKCVVLLFLWEPQ